MSGAIFSAASRREWAAYRAILMQPLHRRRAQGSLSLSWMLIGLALLASVGATRVAEKGWLLFAFGAGIPLGMLLLLWWVLFFGSILAQSSSAAVQLTPRMRERTMRVTVAAWATATLLMSLCMGVPIGYPGQVAVVTGLALLEITVMFSPWRMGAVWAMLCLPALIGIRVLPAWLLALLASKGALALGALLLVLEGRIALRRMFGKPGRVRAWSIAAQAVPQLYADLTRFLKGNRVERVGGQPLIARVLGPVAFDGTATRLLVLAGACVAIRGLIELQGSGAAHERLFMTRCMVLIGVLMLQGMAAHSWAGRMYRRRVEQGLVRLSAAAPPAASINRVLANHLLIRFGAMWTGCSIVAVVVLLVLGANQGETVRAAAACTLALVLAGLPLRDYARGKAAHGASTLVFYLYAAAAIAASFAALKGKLAGNAWAGLALASVVLASLFVWRRWRWMVNAAPAFPAGRNA